jgi:hypothetical protein
LQTFCKLFGCYFHFDLKKNVGTKRVKEEEAEKGGKRERREGREGKREVERDDGATVSS